MTIYSDNKSFKPNFMYGTAWKEEKTEALVTLALQAGFRAIDTANQRKHYFEKAVGDALKKAFDGGLKREDLFLQTKFTYVSSQDHRLPYDPTADFKTQVAQSFASSLEHLNTTYLDSYVLHGPSVRVGLSKNDLTVWEAMEELYDQGKTKVLGISNVRVDQLELLYDQTRIKPSFVQNRCYASQGWDKDVREFCLKNKIIYQGFSLLTANAEIIQTKAFHEILKQIKKTPAQIIFRFAQQVGMLPLTGTSNFERMKEDLAIDDFSLTSAHIELLENIIR